MENWNWKRGTMWNDSEIGLKIGLIEQPISAVIGPWNWKVGGKFNCNELGQFKPKFKPKSLFIMPILTGTRPKLVRKSTQNWSKNSPIKKLTRPNQNLDYFAILCANFGWNSTKIGPKTGQCRNWPKNKQNQFETYQKFAESRSKISLKLTKNWRRNWPKICCKSTKTQFRIYQKLVPKSI